MGISNVHGVPGRSNRPPARVLDGKAVAADLRRGIARDVVALTEAGTRGPALATILVGDDPASEVYVGAKHRACEEAGIRSIDLRLPSDCPAERLASTIAELNEDDEVDGILLQLPLPEHLERRHFIDLIDPLKDVDGLSTASVGALWRSRAGLRPCTPAGVMELLRVAEVSLSGASAVIVGRSELVGRPLAAMLLTADASVTVCHRHTRDLQEHCRQADVLVVACGQPRLIGAHHVRPGAVVIDVGITRTEDGLVGDVDYDAVAGRAAAITPVPGGVGPMTIALLLKNTVRAMELREAVAAVGVRGAR